VVTEPRLLSIVEVVEVRLQTLGAVELDRNKKKKTASMVKKDRSKGFRLQTLGKVSNFNISQKNRKKTVTIKKQALWNIDWKN